MTPEQKSPYVQMARDDKVRYEADMKQYKAGKSTRSSKRPATKIDSLTNSPQSATELVSNVKPSKLHNYIEYSCPHVQSSIYCL